MAFWVSVQHIVKDSLVVVGEGGASETGEGKNTPVVVLTYNICWLPKTSMTSVIGFLYKMCLGFCFQCVRTLLLSFWVGGSAVAEYCYLLLW